MDLVNFKETQIVLARAIPRLTQVMGVEFGALVERATRLMLEVVVELDKAEMQHTRATEMLQAEIKVLRLQIKNLRKNFDEMVMGSVQRPTAGEPLTVAQMQAQYERERASMNQFMAAHRIPVAETVATTTATTSTTAPPPHLSFADVIARTRTATARRRTRR